MSKSASWEDYCANVLRWKNEDLNWRDQTANAGMGLAAEAGEAADATKKFLFYKNSPYSISEFREKVIEEMGDALWYMALMCHSIDSDLGEIMSYNMEKLEKRNSGGT